MEGAILCMDHSLYGVPLVQGNSGEALLEMAMWPWAAKISGYSSNIGPSTLGQKEKHGFRVGFSCLSPPKGFWVPVGIWLKQTSPKNTAMLNSVVLLNMVFPKKGSFFSIFIEQLRKRSGLERGAGDGCYTIPTSL